MKVEVSIPDDLADTLRRRAEASGEAVPAYTSRIVEQAIKSPSLEELLAPLQADFAHSGMTQQEFLEFGQELLDKIRSEKKD